MDHAQATPADAPDRGAARHEVAAQTHDDAGRRHEAAAAFWDERDDAEHAALERRNAELERRLGELERDRAALIRSRSGGDASADLDVLPSPGDG